MQQQRAAEERVARVDSVQGNVCALCGRTMGARTEWHHTVPKSQGGDATVPVHPICHRTIHANISNHDLAGRYAALDVLREHDDIRRFLKWIASKPPDFNAPTRESRQLREASSPTSAS